MNRKHLATLIMFLLLTWSVGISQEQNYNLKITEIGEGTTEDEAVSNSKIVALQQIIKVYVSNSNEIIYNSSILNKLISEETGIFTSVEKVYSKIFPRDRYVVTMEFKISLDKLKTGIQFLGLNNTVEINQFNTQIKKQQTEEQNEINVIRTLIGLLHEPMQVSFDYEIISEAPQSTDAEGKKWKIPLTAVAKTNKNIELCAEFFISTVKSICINEVEIKSYSASNKPFYPLIVFYDGSEYNYYLRKENSSRELLSFQQKWEFYTRLFEVSSGIDVSTGNGNLWNFNKIYIDQYATDPSDGEQIYEFNGSSIWEDHIKYIRFNFLNANQNAAVYKWVDERSMSQIEKMSGYKVKPLGIVSYYYLRGYAVQYDGNHGFIVAPFNLGKMNWDDANNACKDLIISGVGGWELPNENEITLINLTQFRKGIIGDGYEECWTNQQYSQSGTCNPKSATRFKAATVCPQASIFRLGWGFTNIVNKNESYHVRPILRF